MAARIPVPYHQPGQGAVTPCRVYSMSFGKPSKEYHHSTTDACGYAR